LEARSARSPARRAGAHALCRGSGARGHVAPLVIPPPIDGEPEDELAPNPAPLPPPRTSLPLPPVGRPLTPHIRRGRRAVSRLRRSHEAFGLGPRPRGNRQVPRRPQPTD
jgi:hypothetical protein